ncbi:MAG: sugar phosphate isomerase/epimerase [Candidatus Omnitrophica bacterium]|nr:sugar phosphate isomerase/epimerase [Candidatus Omnitrophota bacterium]
MSAFGLSTSWNAFRCRDAESLVSEIRSLGFPEIELSFNLTARLVKGIEEQVDSGQIKVTSVHNFCPIPPGIKRELALPDYYSLASKDEDRRKIAVRQTKVSIDTARRLGARSVVLHCGRVEIMDVTRRLIKLRLVKGRQSPEFKALKARAIRERESVSGQFFENTLRSLEQLEGYARRRQVRLGIETRFYFREIPSFAETGCILKKFSGSAISYWHDTGHAQIMEELGFSRHKDYLDAYGDRLLGVHLHDILGCQDHLAPLKGNLNFSLLKPYLKKDTIRIIEAHYPAKARDLINARIFLERTLNG